MSRAVCFYSTLITSNDKSISRLEVAVSFLKAVDQTNSSQLLILAKKHLVRVGKKIIMWLEIHVLVSTDTSGAVLTSPSKTCFFVTTNMVENWAEDSLKISYDVVSNCGHCLHSQIYLLL